MFVRTALFAALMVTAGSSLARAHHSFAMFDMDKDLTYKGHPMKGGSKGISLFYAIMPDGKRLYHDIARPKGEVER